MATNNPRAPPEDEIVAPSTFAPAPTSVATSGPGDDGPDLAKAAASEAKRQSRKRRRTAKRQEQRAQTSVYVTGVPSDADEDEVAQYFAKCGILQPHGEDGRARVKLYTDSSGRRKGDALIMYARAPSVENAVTLLDGVPLRHGGEPMRVQPASFEHKDSKTSASEDPGSGSNAKEKKRTKHSAIARALVDEALTWDEGRPAPSPAARMVVLTNTFEASTADYGLVREDMLEGCGEFGTVEKVTVFERSPIGAVAVRFGSVADAQECIRIMNGRWYDGRQIGAQFFDGVTDYRVKQTDEEAEKERDKKWEEWLEAEDGNQEAKQNDGAATTDKTKQNGSNSGNDSKDRDAE